MSALCDVLLIAADERIRTRLVAFLESKGQEVEVVDCEDALPATLTRLALSGKLPRVAICDYQTPGCGGLRVIERLQSEYPGIPVILLGPFGDGEVCARARALGANAVFRQPFDLDRLNDHVEGLSPWYP